MLTKWRSALVLLVTLGLLAAGCGDGGDSGAEVAESETEAAASDTADAESESEEPSEAEESDTEAAEGGGSGSIEIDGSSTVEPVSLAIAEEYRAEAPDVEVNVGRAGTGGGFEIFCAGDSDINDASRPISEEEIAACEEGGVEYVELQVGVDALSVVTATGSEFLDCLTFEEMTTLFGPEGPTTWDAVNPEFPAEPVTIFAPDADSGTYDFFIETVMEPNGVEETRQDYQASADDNQIVTGISGTPNSWGFFGFAFFQENEGAVQAIQVDAGEGCVAPSIEAAQDESYPLTRPLFIYVSTTALEENPALGDFVSYYIESVNGLIEDVGYIALAEDSFAETEAALEEALGA